MESTDPDRPGRQPGNQDSGDQAARSYDALKRYSAGKISAGKAAEEIGGGASIHDVFVETIRAGLPLPTPPEEVTKAEVAALRRLYGMPTPAQKRSP